MTDSSALARTTFKNVMWSYGTFATSKLVTLISTVVLARVLPPEDIGLFALGLIVMNCLDALNGLGVGTAYIYQQEDAERSGHVAFTVSIITGAVLTGAAVLVAPLLIDLFGEPRLDDIVPLLAMILAIHSLGNIHRARLAKQLDFKRMLGPECARATAKGIVAIAMAVMGGGVWSLVWGQLAGALTSTLLYWRVTRWLPRLVLEASLARPLLRYGVQITLGGLQATVLRNLDYFFIARRMTSGDLGYYVLAFRIPELVIMNLVGVMGQALFPSYTARQNDVPALRSAFLIVLRYVALLTVPLGIGLAMVAPEVVHVFYSDRWARSITVMEILGVYAVMYSLARNAGDILRAIGRPGLLNQLAVVRLAIAAPMLWLAAGQTIVHVAWAQLISTAIITLITIGLVQRVLGVATPSLVAALRPAMIAAAAMLVGMFVLRAHFQAYPPLVRLLMLVLGGALSYGGVAHLTDRELIREMREFLRRRRSVPVAW